MRSMSASPRRAPSQTWPDSSTRNWSSIVRSSARSMPAENAEPVPVKISERTPGSASARAMASISASIIAALSALRWSGLLSVIIAAGYRASYKTISAAMFVIRFLSSIWIGHRSRGGDLSSVANLSEVNLAEIEFLERFDHARERGLARRKVFARASEWIGSSDDKILQVGMHQAALLARDHEGYCQIVGALDLRRAFLAIFERVLERLGQESIDAAEQRCVNAARKPRLLLIQQAERDEMRALEFEGEVLLGGFGPLLEARAIHTDDLERLVAQVVRFLGVERQNLKGDLGIRNHDRRNRLGAGLHGGSAAMVAVGRP